MAGKRKTYTLEFKLQAVKMITEQKLSIAEVARWLGVSAEVERLEMERDILKQATAFFAVQTN